MRRLYQQIYLTVLASLVLVVIAIGALWRFSFESGPAGEALAMAGEIAAAALPSPQAPPEAQREQLAQLAARLKADLGLFDAKSRPIATAVVSGGRPIEAPDARRHGYWRRGWSLALPDGRWLVVRLSAQQRPPGYAGIAFLALVALAVALAAFPLVRRLTRRLERLQTGVEALGAGDLGARVQVRGRDEVARLAQSFNRAAARIEQLVGSHRMLLANASHELRTPLARIRMGIELLGADADPGRKAALGRDIAELDTLIEEILLASRLDAVPDMPEREAVDLLALAAEEAARNDGCNVEGEPAFVNGDLRLLRRMVRNLLENASRHGAPPIDVSVRRHNGAVALQVRDHGRGVPETQRERVFEPFYRGGAAPGSGLGLALVRTIARRHGGEALCGSAPEGEGALLEVRLPEFEPPGRRETGERVN